jgi:hypothetical protein
VLGGREYQMGLVRAQVLHGFTGGEVRDGADTKDLTQASLHTTNRQGVARVVRNSQGAANILVLAGPARLRALLSDSFITVSESAPDGVDVAGSFKHKSSTEDGTSNVPGVSCFCNSAVGYN